MLDSLGLSSPQLELLKTMAFQLSEIPGIAAVVLGGSYARGTSRSDSDLDVGLYYSEKSPPEIGSGQYANRYGLLSVGSVGQWGRLDSYLGRKDGPFVPQHRPGAARTG
jgi:hypothetical protein